VFLVSGYNCETVVASSCSDITIFDRHRAAGLSEQTGLVSPDVGGGNIEAENSAF
jgi:hypothetical protein